MLKSTYQKNDPVLESSASNITALPPGWTEHVAPSGHTYYFNAELQKSTYTRPAREAVPAPIPSSSAREIVGGFNSASFADGHPSQSQWPHGTHGERDEHHRKRPEIQDRPKHKYVLDSCSPWLLIKTRLGRRFVHNPETGESLWRFPDDVFKAVVEFDKKQREKRQRKERGEPSESEGEDGMVSNAVIRAAQEAQRKKELEALEAKGHESEESEGEGSDSDGRPKRQKLDDGPMEFGEDDLEAELEAEFDLEDEDYGGEDPLTDEERKTLFFQLLDDCKVSPFSAWDKVIEEDQILADTRYTALQTMKSRRVAWDEWSRQKIQESKEARERQAKQDPKVPYFAFLEEHASTKLYWPEFKRKYRKDPVMRDTKVSEKDREKWYREYVKRLTLPQNTLKTDFKSLLGSLSTSVLNRGTSMNALPSALLTDMRYISLSSFIRDPLLEAYIATLPPAPESPITAEQEAELQARQKDRLSRDTALAERERRVDEERRRFERDLRIERGRLREGERELERATHAGRTGLKAQLSNLEARVTKQ